jgi:hypothetical protein
MDCCLRFFEGGNVVVFELVDVRFFLCERIDFCWTGIFCGKTFAVLPFVD